MTKPYKYFRKMSAEERAAIARDYQAGMTYAELCVKYGSTYLVLQKCVNEYGVAARVGCGKRKKRLISPYLEQMMRENDMNYAKLSEATHYAYSNIQAACTGTMGRRLSDGLIEAIAAATGWDAERIRMERAEWEEGAEKCPEKAVKSRRMSCSAIGVEKKQVRSCANAE